MTIKNLLECERRSLDKLKNYQLSNIFKKIGFILFVISFITLFVNAFTINNLVFREITKYSMLIGLLLISISKDKIEDEYIKSLRMQSYAYAFIFGVIFILIQPLFRFIFDMIYNTESTIVKDTGDFDILFILLFIQVFYYELLKRIN